ncbi:unnamed protein product, partial [marine sediment metagenome]
MVRPNLWRRKKFKAKIDGSVHEKRTDAYRTTQVALHTAITTILVEKEIEAKTLILEPAGVPVNEMPFYLNAMREFCKCSRNFTSLTRQNECINIYAEYVEKGLRNNLV